MADPAPSAPLPGAASESRVSPADQMAGLTGEHVELSQPEADEPDEDHDASTVRPNRALSRQWRPSRELLQPPRLRRMTQRNTRPPQLPTQRKRRSRRRRRANPCHRLSHPAPLTPRRRTLPRPPASRLRRDNQAPSPPPPRKPTTIRTRFREALRVRRRSTRQRWSPQP